jgi:DNA-binding response OmpR family regulator
MNRRILIVDDELEMCFLISNLLKVHGHEVFTAETVEVALSVVEDVSPAVIILDANLAGEDGLKLLTFLKRNNPDTRIIIYTGSHHSEDVIQKALKDGADQYLRKGGPLDELVSAVEKALR